MKRLFATVVIVATVSGCATNVMNGIMGSWLGSSINEVQGQWGYPDEQREFNGQTLYIWHNDDSFTMPAQTTVNGTVNAWGGFSGTATTTGGNVVAMNCERILAVGATGLVEAYQWRGNNCPFAEVMQYKNWRKHSQNSTISKQCKPPLRCDG